MILHFESHTFGNLGLVITPTMKSEISLPEMGVAVKNGGWAGRWEA